MTEGRARRINQARRKEAIARCAAMLAVVCICLAMASAFCRMGVNAQQTVAPAQTPYYNFTTGIQLQGTFGANGQCLVSTGTGSAWTNCPSSSGASYPSPTLNYVPKVSATSPLPTLVNSGFYDANGYTGSSEPFSPPGVMSANLYYIRQTKVQISCTLMFGTACITTPNLTIQINGDSTAQLLFYDFIQHFASTPAFNLVGLYMIGGGGGGQAGQLAAYGGPLMFGDPGNTRRWGFNIGCSNSFCQYLHGASAMDIPYNAYWQIGTGTGGSGLSALNFLAYNFGNNADKILTFSRVTIGYRISPTNDTQCNVLVNDAGTTLGTMIQVGSFNSNGPLVGGVPTPGTVTLNVPPGSGKLQIATTTNGKNCEVALIGIDNPSASGLRVIAAGTPGSGMGELMTDPNNFKGVFQAALPVADLQTMTWKDNQSEGAGPFQSQIQAWSAFINAFCRGYNATNNPNACDTLLEGTYTDTTETDPVVQARNAAMRAAVAALPNSYYWDAYYSNGSNLSAIARNCFLANDQSTNIYQHYGPMCGKTFGDMLWYALGLEELLTQKVGHSYSVASGSYASPAISFIPDLTTVGLYETSDKSWGVLGTEHLYNSLFLGQPNTPDTPIATQTGITGSTSHTYIVCGFEPNFTGSVGIGNCSAAYTLTNANAVIDSTNPVMVKWNRNSFAGARTFNVYRDNACVAQAISDTVDSQWDFGQSAGCGAPPTAIQQGTGLYIHSPSIPGVPFEVNMGVNGNGANFAVLPSSGSTAQIITQWLDTSRAHGFTVGCSPTTSAGGTTSCTSSPTSGDFLQWFWSHNGYFTPNGAGATRNSWTLNFQSIYQTSNVQASNLGSQVSADGSVGYMAFTFNPTNAPTTAVLQTALLANATSGNNKSGWDWQNVFSVFNGSALTGTFHLQSIVTSGSTTPDVYDTASCTISGTTIPHCGIAAPYLQASSGYFVNGGHIYTRHTTLTATLSPAAVAANTCAAQSLTVSGLTSGDLVLNAGNAKPTFQAGLSLEGILVTGANTGSFNFCNNTGSPITPTASESYTLDVEQ